MKDLGLFSGTLEMDTKKLQMQLNAIKKATTILGDELAGIDRVYEEDEEVGKLTKEVSIEYGDVVMIRYSTNKDGYGGTFAKVIGMDKQEDPVLILQLTKPCAENHMRSLECNSRAS